MQTLRTDNKYLKFIAYLQIIGIILVVAGHSMHEYPDGTAHGTSTLVYRMMYSFRMPLFLFVSGFLMVYTTRIADAPKTMPVKFIMSKVKRLLLPMAVLTTVTFMPRSLLSSVADDSMPFTFHNFIMAFVTPEYMPIPYFWFLHASFILLAITFSTLYFAPRLGFSVKSVTVFLCAIFVLYAIAPFDTTNYLSLAKIQKFGLYFVFGCAYAIFVRPVDSLIPWTNPWFLLATVLLWSIAFFLFEKTPAIIICSLLGIAMCICVAKIIEEQNWTFLDHLQGANYIIFLLSWYFNVTTQQVLSHFIILPWWCYSILSLVCGVYIPWLGYKYLEKHRNSRWVRITAFLLGQSFRTRHEKQNPN